MGYIRSFTQHNWFTTQEWTEICSKVRVIISTSDIKLTGPLGDENSQPIINDQEISFNMHNSKYDSWYYAISKFNFTKNLNKSGGHQIRIEEQYSPYDNIITNILNTIKEISPNKIYIKNCNSLAVLYK